MTARGFRSALYGNGVTDGLTRLVDRVDDAKDESIRVLALTLVRQTKIFLSFPGRGRVYGNHVASAPGHPPAVDMGQLHGSIQMERLGHGHYAVGTNDEKAPWLEFGTVGPEYTGGRILARPFLRPAFKSVELWWKREISARLRRAGSGGGR